MMRILVTRKFEAFQRSQRSKKIVDNIKVLITINIKMFPSSSNIFLDFTFNSSC